MALSDECIVHWRTRPHKKVVSVRHDAVYHRLGGRPTRIDGKVAALCAGFVSETGLCILSALLERIDD